MKKTIAGGVLAALLLGGVGPYVALAQETTERPARGQALSCDSFDELKTRFGERFDGMADRMKERRDKFTERANEKRDNRKARRDERRDNRSDRLDSLFAKLRERTADHAEASAAVEAFISAVLAAHTTYRDAANAEIDSAHAAISEIISSQYDSVTEVIDQFRADVDAAFADAKTRCESGESRDDIRTTLAETLKAAREDMKESLNPKDQHEEIKAIMETAREAIKVAREDMQAAIQAAKEGLREALKALKPERDAASGEATADTDDNGEGDDDASGEDEGEDDNE